MANQTAGFGFRQAPTVGSTPATGGQAEYKVKSGQSSIKSVEIIRKAINLQFLTSNNEHIKTLLG